jgi:hypothetical protein
MTAKSSRCLAMARCIAATGLTVLAVRDIVEAARK